MQSPAAVSRDNFTSVCNDPDTEDVGKLTDALATCDAMAREPGLTMEDRETILAARGRIYHRLGKRDLAIRNYTAALELDPRDSYALNNRGQLHAWNNQFEAAIADLDASLALRPDNPDAYRYRGLSNLALGRYDIAARDLERSGMDVSTRSMVAAQAADEAIARGDPKAGIRLATEALRLNPSNREARRLRSQAYWKTGQKDLSIADDRMLHPID